MHLKPDQLLFGVAPRLLIDGARQIHSWDMAGEGRSFSVEQFSEALGAPVSEAGPVLHAMVADGFFVCPEGDSGRYVATPKLGQLALAKLSHGISRKEAGELLALIVKKAAWVNAHPDRYDHRIACVVVFGSWLIEKPHLGDLDIGVALEELPDRLRNRDGASLTEWIRRGEAARNRALRALRLRQPEKISVHQLDEVTRLGTAYEVVFGALPGE